METIRLNRSFTNVIMTRDSVEEFFDSLADFVDNNLIFDFSGIEFISRSAAHEYIKQKAACSKRIRETNMVRDIKAMFLLVAKQLKKTISV
ncbi:MAG: hypothetical protein ABIG28_02915 [archaeon]